MSMNKSCPMFKKEKAIRQIMCEQSCTYRKALTEYYNVNISQQNKELIPNPEDDTIQELNVLDPNNNEKSYRDVLLSQVHYPVKEIDPVRNNHSFPDKTRQDIILNKSSSAQTSKTLKRTTDSRRYEKEETYETNQDLKKNERSDNFEGQQKDTPRNTVYLKKLMEKLNDIFFSNSNFAVKIKLVVSVILEETIQFVLGFVREGDVIKKIFSLFKDDS